MWTAPKGNAYYNLAHQYIAAKLNVLDGASASAIAADLAQAEAWFNAYAPTNGFWKKNQNVITVAGRLAPTTKATSVRAIARSRRLLTSRPVRNRT
jgi:hypothetical protein